MSKNKLLGVYSIDEEKLKDSTQKKIISQIKKQTKICDLILVSDYGHGLISKKTANEFNRSKTFFLIKCTNKCI